MGAVIIQLMYSFEVNIRTSQTENSDVKKAYTNSAYPDQNASEEAV